MSLLYYEALAGIPIYNHRLQYISCNMEQNDRYESSFVTQNLNVFL